MEDKQITGYFLRVLAALLIALMATAALSLSGCSNASGDDYDPTAL